MVPQTTKEMTAQNFYDIQRRLGFTDDITSNPDPDYNFPFYHAIFRLMEEYARHEAEDRYEKALAYYSETHLVRSERLKTALRIAAGGKE